MRPNAPRVLCKPFSGVKGIEIHRVSLLESPESIMWIIIVYTPLLTIEAKHLTFTC